MLQVQGIYRYPIKGFSAQPVNEVALEAGRPFPFDRSFAFVRPGLPVNAEAPQWTKKGLFAMLMLDPGLAEFQTELDHERLQLSVRQAGQTLLQVDLGSAAGCAELEHFLERRVPSLAGRPKLVHAPHGHFMDKPDNVVSLINLATVRSLERDWGVAIDPLRFRANFYVDGAAPWAEFEWLGTELRLGDATLRAERRNGRCGATNVNPATGRRDLDIPTALRKAFGHKDLGIYLSVCAGGSVKVGDALVLPDPSRAVTSPRPSPPFAARGFMCGGCYFVYDEASASSAIDPVPPPFASLSESFRCPDCGGGKENFQPYAQA